MVRLNEGQKRLLSVTLRHLEETLLALEALIEHPAPARLEQIRMDIDAKARELLLSRSAALRSEVVGLAADCGLPMREASARRIVLSQLANAWVGLEEIQPDKLAHYGALDPSVTVELGPTLRRLADEMLALQDVIETDRRSVPQGIHSASSASSRVR
jgi:hypothetical protein